MAARSKARKQALDILFESELRDSDPLATLKERGADTERPVRDYAATLVEAVVLHREAIDRRISESAGGGWTIGRMPRVDRAALRIAVCEIDYLEVPTGVAIAEALVLVGELSTDESPAYVNGVLGAVAASPLSGCRGRPAS